MDGFTVPDKLIVQVTKFLKDQVCQVAYDMGKNPNALGNECIEAVLHMMEDEHPVVPDVVMQYKALKKSGALKTQLQAEVTEEIRCLKNHHSSRKKN